MAYRDTDYEKEYVKGHVAGFEKGCTNGYVSGIAEGRRLEREAIVAWLRAEAVSHEATWGGRTVDFLETTASEVERGEHEKGSGE